MKLVLETNHNHMCRPPKQITLWISASRAVARAIGWRSARIGRPSGRAGVMMTLVNVDPEAGTNIVSVLVTVSTPHLAERTAVTVVDARADATTTTTTTRRLEEGATVTVIGVRADATTTTTTDVVVTESVEMTNAGGTTGATHAIDRLERVQLDGEIQPRAHETIGAGQRTDVTAVADVRQDALTRTARRDSAL